MPEFKGRLESIENKITKKGDKTYSIIKVDGISYNVWDPKLIEGLQASELVMGSYTQNEKYRNLDALKVGIVESHTNTDGPLAKPINPLAADPNQISLVQLMKDILIDVNRIYESDDLTKGFKEEIDWSSITSTIYIADTRRRGIR